MFDRDNLWTHFNLLSIALFGLVNFLNILFSVTHKSFEWTSLTFVWPFYFSRSSIKMRFNFETKTYRFTILSANTYIDFLHKYDEWNLDLDYYGESRQSNERNMKIEHNKYVSTEHWALSNVKTNKKKYYFPEWRNWKIGANKHSSHNSFTPNVKLLRKFSIVIVYHRQFVFIGIWTITIINTNTWRNKWNLVLNC